VGDVLVQVAEHARLLVVGTREPSASCHYRAGSVVHYCISHATCPVAAIPSPSTPASGWPLRPVRPGSAVRSS
jgi:nucleotide-binding universal stress UspA family protein